MESFPIAPAATRAYWLIPIFLVLVLGLVLLIIGRSVTASRTASFQVSPAGLKLSGDWYGRTIALEDLRIDEMRRVDLSEESELKPRWRTMGTGLPGYQSGWFRLQGGEKALLYLTDRDRAVYIPTTRGYGVLISPADPDGFLRAMQALRPANLREPS